MRKETEKVCDLINAVLQISDSRTVPNKTSGLALQFVCSNSSSAVETHRRLQSLLHNLLERTRPVTLVKMVSRLVCMLLVSVLLSFQIVFLSARPAFDPTVGAGISWKRSPSQSSHSEVDIAVDVDSQQTLDCFAGSVGCKDERWGTFAALIMTTSSRLAHTDRFLMDLSPLQRRHLNEAEPGPRPPPGSPPDEGRSGR